MDMVFFRDFIEVTNEDMNGIVEKVIVNKMDVVFEENGYKKRNNENLKNF